MIAMISIPLVAPTGPLTPPAQSEVAVQDLVEGGADFGTLMNLSDGAPTTTIPLILHHQPTHGADTMSGLAPPALWPLPPDPSPASDAPIPDGITEKQDATDPETVDQTQPVTFALVQVLTLPSNLMPHPNRSERAAVHDPVPTAPENGSSATQLAQDADHPRNKELAAPLRGTQSQLQKADRRPAELTTTPLEGDRAAAQPRPAPLEGDRTQIQLPTAPDRGDHVRAQQPDAPHLLVTERTNPLAVNSQPMLGPRQRSAPDAARSVEQGTTVPAATSATIDQSPATAEIGSDPAHPILGASVGSLLRTGGQKATAAPPSDPTTFLAPRPGGDKDNGVTQATPVHQSNRSSDPVPPQDIHSRSMRPVLAVQLRPAHPTAFPQQGPIVDKDNEVTKATPVHQSIRTSDTVPPQDTHSRPVRPDLPVQTPPANSALFPQQRPSGHKDIGVTQATPVHQSNRSSDPVPPQDIHSRSPRPVLPVQTPHDLSQPSPVQPRNPDRPVVAGPIALPETRPATGAERPPVALSTDRPAPVLAKQMTRQSGEPPAPLPLAKQTAPQPPTAATVPAGQMPPRLAPVTRSGPLEPKMALNVPAQPSSPTSPDRAPPQRVTVVQVAMPSPAPSPLRWAQAQDAIVQGSLIQSTTRPDAIPRSMASALPMPMAGRTESRQIRVIVPPPTGPMTDSTPTPTVATIGPFWTSPLSGASETPPTAPAHVPVSRVQNAAMRSGVQALSDLPPTTIVWPSDIAADRVSPNAHQVYRPHTRPEQSATIAPSIAALPALDSPRTMSPQPPTMTLVDSAPIPTPTPVINPQPAFLRQGVGPQHESRPTGMSTPPKNSLTQGRQSTDTDIENQMPQPKIPAGPIPHAPDKAKPKPEPMGEQPAPDVAAPAGLTIPPPAPPPAPPSRPALAERQPTLVIPLSQTAPQTPALVTEGPTLPRKLPETIAKAATSLTRDEAVELLLDPAELGRVRFEMTTTGDRLQVNLSVERAETLDLLRRNIEVLRHEFREAGFDAATLTFGGWGSGQGEDPSTAPHPHGPDIDLPAAEPPAQPTHTRALSDQGLNLRL